MAKKKNYTISPHIESQDVSDIAEVTGNVYESLAVIGKRSRQISRDLKEELQSKLNEFASTTDSLEEIHENKEQIEISKFYERMPHPTLLALEEFMDDKIHHRRATKQEIEAKEARRRQRNSNRKGGKR